MAARNPERWLRHPDFDQHWQRHQWLVWWFATRMAIRFKGVPQRDLVGTIVLLFNRALHTHNPAKGKLSTYLGKRLADGMMRTFLRYDSDARACRYHANRSNDPVDRRARVDESFGHNMDLFHQIEEEPPAWNDCFSFEEKADMWGFLTSVLPGTRLRTVVLRRFRDGWDLVDIGKELGVTRTRVHQIECRALLMLRNRLWREERFRHLFKD